MNKDFYMLANEIADPMDGTDNAASFFQKQPDDAVTEQYRNHMLAAIRQEKAQKRRRRLPAAAACILLMAAVTGLFHNEVQAAIEKIHVTLSTVFSPESRMSHYTEIIHTSVSSGDYVITLEEAIAAPEKLYVRFTTQREDGQPMTDADNSLSLYSELLIDGQSVCAGSGSSWGFDSERRTVRRESTDYLLSGFDLSGEHSYELRLSDQNQLHEGEWVFQFKADGSEIYADTKTMALGTRYTLPDGSEITLDELSLNELEQKITFHISADAMYYQDFELHAVDEQGRMTKFDCGSFGNGRGYLKNSFVPQKDAPVLTWVAEDAQQLTVTFYIIDMPEIDGLNPDDYMQQIGETAVWDLTKLQGGP